MKPLTKITPQHQTSPAQQTHVSSTRKLLQQLAAELNKRLDPDLIQGRVVLFADLLSVQLSAPQSTSRSVMPPLIECNIGINGQGLFQELSIKCLDKDRGFLQSSASWPMSTLPDLSTITDEVIRLVQLAALTTIRHHQQAILAITPLTNPTKEKIK